MVGLLDLNVLIALAWPSHVHHRHAHEWFSAHRAEGWATCPLTQCGFVRLSSNPKIIENAVSPHQALALLRQMVRIGNHVFWPDAVDLTESADIPTGRLAGHRQITDAYLLGLATRNHGKLVTFDAAISQLVLDRDQREATIDVIPTG